MRFLSAVYLFVLLCSFSLSAQTDSATASSSSDATVDGTASATAPVSSPGALSEDGSSCDSQTCADADRFSMRQVKLIQTHKKLAYTTGGLVLAAGALGGIRFYQLWRDGHLYRDAIGFEENSTNIADQRAGVKSAWNKNSGQALRVLHGTTIASAVVCYTATATIELSIPRMSRRTDRLSPVNIHKGLFITHALMMAANVGLGFAESYALSQGNHDIVKGLGAAHAGLGIAAPIVMIGSGLVYKLPI